jgi:hypothetical protein
MTTMKTMTIQRFALAYAIALGLASCAKPGAEDKLAFTVCFDAAKKDAKYAKAQFATYEQSNIQASTGDADIRVNIPYEMDGKKGLYQCIATKQIDGTYKVAF